MTVLKLWYTGRSTFVVRHNYRRICHTRCNEKVLQLELENSTNRGNALRDVAARCTAVLMTTSWPHFGEYATSGAAPIATTTSRRLAIACFQRTISSSVIKHLSFAHFAFSLFSQRLALRFPFTELFISHTDFLVKQKHTHAVRRHFQSHIRGAQIEPIFSREACRGMIWLRKYMRRSYEVNHERSLCTAAMRATSNTKQQKKVFQKALSMSHSSKEESGKKRLKNALWSVFCFPTRSYSAAILLRRKLCYQWPSIISSE